MSVQAGNVLFESKVGSVSQGINLGFAQRMGLWSLGTASNVDADAMQVGARPSLRETHFSSMGAASRISAPR